MTTFNENFDPHSLPDLSNLLTRSAHKQNKRTANKEPLTSPGLKKSFLHNATTHHCSMLESAVKLPILALPSSQSIVASHDKVTEETRLPISPPPEEEIRIKQLSTHGIIPKEPNSRLPVRSRPGAFKIPGLPQSSAPFQQQATRLATGRSSQGSVPTVLVPPCASTAFKPNSRKRTRSVLPLPLLHGDSKLTPTAPTSSNQSSTNFSSPNPRARKQPKIHDTGIYTGSGFKRRHKRGTSAESLDSVGDGHIRSPVSGSLKSPARKKRHDPAVVDYTPERERISISTSKGSRTKRKPQTRRSSTPDVRYEPPTEQFTPPRDVILQIPSSITSSRTRNTKPSVSTEVKSSIDRKVVKVKAERLTSPFPLPPLDLSKPVPPPSPSDDPLLLVGPPLIVQRSATPAVALSIDAPVRIDDMPQDGLNTPIRVSSTSARNVNESLWNFGRDLMNETALMDVAFDGPSTFNATFHPDDSDPGDNINHDADQNLPYSAPTPIGFDPDGSAGSHIFHSDDEDVVGGEDEGEFTGRFKFYSVPVKQDPPSSATRARRESWGQPISPFPFTKRFNRSPSSEGTQDSQILLDEDSPPPSPSVGRRRSVLPAQELEAAPPALKAQAGVPRTKGFTLSEIEARLEARSPKGKVIKTEVPPPQADWEDVPPNMQNRKGSPSNDDEDVRSVEREITPIDDRESSTPHISGQTLSPSLNDPGRSIKTTEDIADQQICFETSSIKTSQPSDHPVAHCDETGGNPPELEVAHDGDSFCDEHIPPPGVIEVSSDDPKAAARAAAILKLHHSYIVDGDVTFRARRRSSPGFLRQSSFPFGDRNMDSDHNEESIRRARRKSTIPSAGVMDHQPQQIAPSPLMRSTLTAPGSPSLPTISPEDALREAETEIRAASASPGRPRMPLQSISFATQPLEHRVATPPSPDMNRPQIQEPPNQTGNVKEWTKAHWKTLDMCFTDERLAVGSATGLNNGLAEVDDIEIGSVVERFLAQMADDEDWDPDMLLRRATVLSGRQRAGKGAPPSPGQLVFRNTAPEFVVPVLTPPAISRALSLTTEARVPTKLPPSLLAPRYSHLHEEVTTAPSTPPEIPTLASRPSAAEIDTPESRTHPVKSRGLSQITTAHSSGLSIQPSGDVSAPPSAVKRVLNYVGSIIGRNGTIVTSKPLQPGFKALPLPPPEMRQVTRGPINTPAKKPIPKSQPPRELVHLTEIQLPTKPSQFPKAKSAKEMVQLNHVEPPRSVQRPRTVSGPIIVPGRTRKDSSGSVKDLIKNFEAVQKNTEEEMKRSHSRLAMRKVASVGDFNARPLWKP